MFLTKSAEIKELKIKELEKNLKSAEQAIANVEIAKTELSNQLEKKSELLSQEKDKNENLLKLIAELQKIKSEKEEDVIIEYFLKTKK